MSKQIKLSARQGGTTPKSEPEAEQHGADSEPDMSSQRNRRDIGRYLLQVDRQTKGSYATAEAAQAAGLVIKKNHPKVQVSVYDSVDTANTLIVLPTN